MRRRFAPAAATRSQRLGLGLIGVNSLASAGVSALLARGHAALCATGQAQHCGWCFAAAGFALLGLAALFAAVRVPARALG